MRPADIAKTLVIAAFLAVAGSGVVQAAASPRRAAVVVEDYAREPMPPGFQVTNNELEGPVFADPQGRTLYIWKFTPLRVGEAGDRAGTSTCTNEKATVNGGFAEPYPGGLLLPDLENRPTCVDVWPPVLADANAKPVGKWTVIARDDGTKQWAYKDQAVYTSVLDRAPGDVLGASYIEQGSGGFGYSLRDPIGPAPNVPPGFAVIPTVTGRVLVVTAGRSVYTWDKDGENKSNCDAACLQDWKPVLAPSLARARGEFTAFERAPGVKQWAYRNRPLYTFVEDPEGEQASRVGGDVPGWHNVYTQKILPPPKEFTLQDSATGELLADARGMTLYAYFCVDDAQDQLACDHPDSPQDYRLTICGGGDPDTCVRTFPYVPAAANAKSESRLWSVMAIDPKTGRRASAGQAGALNVWAYRARPVYTFSGDREPGDTFASGWGETQALRNGFRAMIMRDDFFFRDRK